MTQWRVTLVVLVVSAGASVALAQPPDAEPDPIEPEAEPPPELERADEAPWWDGTSEPPPEAPAEPPPAPPVDREPTPAEPPTPPPVDADDDDGDAEEGRFVFGSYGRVVAASDLDGGTGRDADIVSHGPRIDEGTYAELELRREDAFGADLRSRIVATLAIAGPLFHFDGDFDERLAIRNLFLEVGGLGLPELSLWAGSRMVRGDDVYLLDFWPMDDLNAVGGGVRLGLAPLEASLTVGLARPNDPFQRQVIDAVAPAGFTPEEVVILDRPRLVLATKGTVFPVGRGAHGVKASLYGEVHDLPAGEREDDSGVIVPLPADGGWVLGAQLGGWLTEPEADEDAEPSAHRVHAFANLFLRYARGLGAYDPLGVPFREGSVIDTARAEELSVALSASFEYAMFGVQLGAWVRRFRDADPTLLDRAALAEGAVAVRPHVWLGDWVGIAAEGSYQGLETTGLDDRTGEPIAGGVWKLGLIPYVTPNGRGTYTRPHLRLIYSMTRRDAGARALYPARDPRSRERTEHFLGVGAEWWFDSSSYQ